MKEILVKYELDCYYGKIEGIFVTTKEELEASYGETAYFGEVLGKHSEVEDYLSKESFEIVTTDTDAVDAFKCTVGFGFGYNPLEYITDYSEE